MTRVVPLRQLIEPHVVHVAAALGFI